MSRLKRFAIGAGITLVVLSGFTAFWYQGHYTLPASTEGKYAIPSPNGFDTLQEAISLTVKRNEGIRVIPELVPGSNTEFKTQPLAGRLRLLKANDAAIAKTREALAQSYVTPPHTDMNARLGIALRSHAWLLVFAGETCVDSENLAEATRYFLDTIELGVTIPAGGDARALYYGTACETMGTTPLYQAIDRLDTPTTQYAIARLEKIAQKRTPFPEIVQVQRRSFNREMRALFTQNPVLTWKHVGASFEGLSGFNSAIVGETDLPEPTLLDKARQFGLQTLVTYQGPKPTMTELNHWMDSLEAQSKLPWNAQRSLLKESGQGTYMARLLGPGYKDMEFYDVRARTYLALLQTRLRLRAAFLETGRYPATLENLPVDPFSPARSLLSYKSDGITFTLWSVGPDAQDNGGAPVPSARKDKKRLPTVNVTSQGDIRA